MFITFGDEAFEAAVEVVEVFEAAVALEGRRMVCEVHHLS